MLFRMRALALLIALSSTAWAFGDSDRLALAQLDLGGRTTPRPSATRRLAWEIEKRTSILTVGEPVSVKLSDEKALAKNPLLYLRGDGGFTLPVEPELDRLRRHLAGGGLLVIDAAADNGFDASVRALVGRLFPRQGMERIPAEHVVYKTFYLLQRPVGRTADAPFLEGVSYDGRLVVIYSKNDLAGAWAKDGLGHWEEEVVPGGERQREMAIRLGVNLAMYALCLDYKDDQVHVPFILRRRQWRFTP
jgi:hypothetical protein